MVRVEQPVAVIRCQFPNAHNSTVQHLEEENNQTTSFKSGSKAAHREKLEGYQIDQVPFRLRHVFGKETNQSVKELRSSMKTSIDIGISHDFIFN